MVILMLDLIIAPGSTKGVSRAILVGVVLAALIVGGIGGYLLSQPPPPEEPTPLESELLVYGTIDLADVQPVISVFGVEHPEVDVQYEEFIPPTLLSRIQAEIDAGERTADLVLASHTATWSLQLDGLLQSYVSPERENLPEGLYDTEGQWDAVLYLPIVFLYNTENVQADQVPRTLEELSDPQWEGRVIMHDVTLGSIGTQYLASLREYMDLVEWDGFVSDLATNVQPTLSRRTSAIVDGVSTGEWDIGLVAFLHDVVSYKEDGAPVEWFLPEEIPYMSTFTSGGILEAAESPRAAEAFLDFLLGETAQTVLGNTPVRFPVRVGVGATYSVGSVLPGEEIQLYPTEDAFINRQDWADDFEARGFGAP
ncbi:MAG: ABC transporter substrate-binding protein [Candidatus Geothermarchaeales archaeon]